MKEYADIVAGLSGTITATVGFDGYIDTIVKVARNSEAMPNEPYFKTMAEFGEYISGKSQKSCSLELKTVNKKGGGNMPIFSMALARLSADVNCIGALGYPKISEAFKELGEECKLYSVCEAGTCQALEFCDGKVMLANNDGISRLDYTLLVQRIKMETLIDLYNNSNLLGMLNWSELEGSTSIWKGLQKEILPNVKGEKTILIDCSDFSYKTDDEIKEMVDLIGEFGEQFERVVSLNRNETEQLCRIFEIVQSDTEKMARSLKDVLKAKLLVLHYSDCSYCHDGERLSHKQTVYIDEPKLQTGGGDNFNAGLMYAYMNGLPPEDCLSIGNAVSGFYVANAHSPNKAELIEWIQKNHNKY